MKRVRIGRRLQCRALTVDGCLVACCLPHAEVATVGFSGFSGAHLLQSFLSRCLGFIGGVGVVQRGLETSSDAVLVLSVCGYRGQGNCEKDFGRDKAYQT